MTMKYGKLGNTDIEVSAVAFGAWGLGGGSVWEGPSLTAEDTAGLLDAASDCGISYIDTAPVYGMGRSEELLGNALRGRRNRFILQTKCSLNWRKNGGRFHYARDGYTVCCNTGRDAVRKDAEDSLRRLQTDCIDVLIVHYTCRSWPEEETVSALEELIREGKIRAYGLSNSTPEELNAYCSTGAAPALVQEQFSLLAPRHGREYFPACREKNVTFQAYGILEEGYLTGPEKFDLHFGKNDIRTRLPWMQEPHRGRILTLYREVWEPLCRKYGCSYANLMEAWTLAQHESMNILTGFRRIQTIQDTVKCLDLKLEAEDLDLISRTAVPAQVSQLDK